MPASIGVNLRVTGHCDQGGRKYMEDLFSVAYQQTEDEKDLEYAFFGIFDGHGGSEAAAFAKEHLMDSVVKQRQFWSDNDDDVLRAIRNGYMTTHLNMWRELEKWPKTLSGLPSTAGTTASVAFIRRGKIYIGHVGDSAIVLGYQEEGKEEWKAKPLTLDHKPESVAEMERIQRSGGKVLAKAGVPRVVWNRPKPGHRGPLKKTTPMEEIPFLAVARSLGDLWSYNSDKDEFIVSPDPDVGVLIIDPSKFRCLIFGTDGLWNMISPEMAVHLVQKAERHNDAATVAEATNSGPPGKPRRWLNPSKSLVDCALERWATTRMRADNTSVVSLMLDPPGPPRAEVLRGRGRPPAPAPPGAAPAPSPPARDDDKIRRKLPLSRDSTAKLDAAVPSEDPAESASPGRVPASGLAILDRFPEEDAVASADVPPSAPPALQMATVPLPPCASLDGRFSTSRDSFVSVHCASADSPQDSPRDDPEREADMTNYGNPSDSYFISRLLNKSQLKNSLQNVFEEILCGAREGEAADDRIETVDLSESPVGEESPVGAVQESPDPPTESPAFEPAESIQINEVSSSSPIDVPNESKIRKAKPQVAAVAERPQRNLRSHDAPVVAPRKPQTRLNAAPCIIRNRTARQKSPEPKPNRDRIVILNRPKGILIPNLLQPAKPHPENPIKSKPLHKPTEKRQSPDVGARMTRSRDVEDVNEANFPLGKSRQVKNRPEAEAKPRRSDRPFLAAKNARSDHLESSKENFLEETLAQSGKSSKRRNSGAAIELEPKEKRRTRLNDRKQNETGDVSSTETLLVLHIAATTARRVKPCRKTALSEEVHSTTTDSAFDIPSRALRSKNDLDSTDEQPAQTQSDKPFDKIKRALRSSDALKLADGKRFVMNKVRISQVLKTKDFQPNVEIERLDAESIRQTRSAANAAPAPTKRVMAIGLAKRLNGRTPWPPALVTRNRLRKKFSK